MIKEVVSQLQLQKHPEGGYYKELYRSAELAKPPARFNAKTRAWATGIYYFLESNDFGTFHRVKSDETWFFHAGGTLSIHVIYPDGTLLTHKLGNQIKNKNTQFQITLPANVWFAETVDEPDSYVLASCYVSPGFDYADLELANRKKLIAEYPAHKELITKLTRIT
ncbi:MAG: cupin domain-containing protein [Pseudomonadota bacterium]